MTTQLSVKHILCGMNKNPNFTLINMRILKSYLEREDNIFHGFHGDYYSLCWNNVVAKAVEFSHLNTREEKDQYLSTLRLLNHDGNCEHPNEENHNIACEYDRLSKDLWIIGEKFKQTTLNIINRGGHIPTCYLQCNLFLERLHWISSNYSLPCDPVCDYCNSSCIKDPGYD